METKILHWYAEWLTRTSPIIDEYHFGGVSLTEALKMVSKNRVKLFFIKDDDNDPRFASMCISWEKIDRKFTINFYLFKQFMLTEGLKRIKLERQTKEVLDDTKI
jgi:hypothetical protein